MCTAGIVIMKAIHPFPFKCPISYGGNDCPIVIELCSIAVLNDFL